MKFSTAIQSTVTALALIWSVTAFAQTADFVFANGKIITVNDQFTTVQALAIKGERIIATGTDADIEKFKGPSTQLIDLQRKVALAQVRLERAVGGAGVLAAATTQPTTSPTTQRNP